jgi:4-diphosphocytidyl-2C-methyl-D-erythritol kinase
MYGAQYACMSGTGSTIFGIFDRTIDTTVIKFDYDFKTYSLE